MTERLRVIFFGELGSTFSLIHYAVLGAHTNVLLWVAGRKPSRTAPAARQPFSSFSDFWERLQGRSKLELEAIRLIRRPLIGLNIAAPIRFTSRGDADLASSLSALHPDLIVSAGFSRLIAPTILALPRLGAFNCHPSPLPRYAGSNPWFWMLKSGERQSAVTLHRMVLEADAGNIVRQEFLAIAPIANHQQLYNDTSVKSAALLSECLAQWKDGPLNESSQDLSRRTFFAAPNDDDRRIDWSLSSEQILNLVRATSPAPGAWAVINGKRCIIRRTSRMEGRGDVGKIIRPIHDGVIVGCGDGALLVRAAQVEGHELRGLQIARALE